MRAISKNRKEFIAIIALALVAAVVGGYILTKQRLTLPGWVPGIGTEFTVYKAQMSTAQAVTPGQGQTVQIAGVDVGELTKVDLVDGRAIVSMKVDPDHPFYRDASAMLRPKTGLNDMVLQVDPGTRAAGEAPDGFTIPVDRTLPNVNFDEFLSALDGDTRASLQLLLGGAGEAVRGQGRELSNTLRRFEPLGRNTVRLNRELAVRTRNIKRSVHNFRLLAEELGRKDDELAGFVDANNAVFRSFANQDRRLRETLRELPEALRKTNTALAKVEPLGTELGQTLGDLRPFARDLGPALRATRPFLLETEPIIRTQLRPFARDAQPVAKLVRAGGGRADGDHPQPAHLAQRRQRAGRRARLQPQGPRGGLPLLVRVVRAPGELDLQHAGRPRRRAARRDRGLVRGADRSQRAGGDHGPARGPRHAERHAQPVGRQLHGAGGARVNKQAPSASRIIVMAGFALSCFGLLLYLWLAFGGPIPLKPKGYRMDVSFPEAQQLAEQADVRISGVPIGKVQGTVANKDTGTTVATLEIEEKYAPVPKDTRAILRQKTLLGETYVELTPGNASAGMVAEGGALPVGRGLADRRGRRAVPHVQPPAAARLPDLDAAAGAGQQGSRARHLGGDRQPRTVRRGDARPGEDPQRAGAGSAERRARHR